MNVNKILSAVDHTLLSQTAGEAQIKEIVTEITGIPIGSAERQEDLHLEDVLNETVLGQREAVHSLSKAILRHKAGLSDPLRPVGVFLFLGESGVGKITACKTS